MRIYIFKSEANGGLCASAGDEAGSNLPAGFGPGIRRASLRRIFHRRTISLGSESKVRSKCMAFNCGAPNGRSWLLPTGESHLSKMAELGWLATGALERKTRDRRTGRGP